MSTFAAQKGFLFRGASRPSEIPALPERISLHIQRSMSVRSGCREQRALSCGQEGFLPRLCRLCRGGGASRRPVARITAFKTAFLLGCI
jgi:hypothetical protein